ncbi:MAG: transcription elongation factor GreA [Lachnospiraceae bacterium]|nr:transcription elongation factor GreA [Lachnospiraceae bacterium]
MNNELTKKDIEDMKAEIEHRTVVVRKELLEEVKRTRAFGDLSENFEYHAAKKAKNENESRIRYLDRMIRTATIIEDATGKEEIGVNKTVRIRMEDDGAEQTLTLVTTVRGDALKGLISVESPLGKALMGHKTGEKVHVEVNPEIAYDVTILSVEDADPGVDSPLKSY